MSNQVISASQLYAMSQGVACEGPRKCHWCASPCKELWRHDDVTSVPFERTSSTALRPIEPFVCTGCWMFSRNRVSIRFLNGRMRDGQAPMHHSWWITEKGAWAVGDSDKSLLLDEVRGPPRKFALMVISTPPPSLKVQQPINHIQLAKANDNKDLTPSSPLVFTIDGVVYEYTIAELESGIKSGPQGLQGGVAALLSLCDVKYKNQSVNLVLEEEPEPKNKRGRPKPIEDGRSLKKKVV